MPTRLRPSTRQRLKELRVEKRDTYDDVVTRLIDEHEARAPQSATASEPNRRSGLVGPLVQGVRRLVGKDGEKPGEQAAGLSDGGVPA
ncbi:MAG TPA: hypothetical protein VGV89_01540 [Thermoplasmata archaeon]|nr:hypothetical protein [Thermoplasmata archaeon]